MLERTLRTFESQDYISADHSQELSVHEKVFNFRDATFRHYMMQSGDAESWPDMVPRLAESDNPIVLLAAGSAALECALWPEMSPKKLLDKRFNLLNTARKHWSDALTRFPSYIESQGDDQLKYDLMFMQIQTTYKLAYIPMMKAAASLYARRPMPAGRVADVRRKTARRVLAAAKDTLRATSQGEFPEQRRRGLLGELACGIVGMVDVPAKYLLMPSSFRQDHDPAQCRRADLIGIAVEQPLNKALVQVVSGRNMLKSMKGQRVFFNTRRDLSPYLDEQPEQTVQGFIAIHEGRGNPEIESRLAVLGRVMTQRLDRFAAKRM